MLEKPSRGVIYTRQLIKQIERIVLHQARWCNWLTRRPLKAESTGSSPVRAISDHNLRAAAASRPFHCKDVIFRCEWLFLQVLHCLAANDLQCAANRLTACSIIDLLLLSPRLFGCCGYKLNASFTNCACSSW